MASGWKVGGILLLLTGFLIGVLAALPVVAPEGTWADGPTIAGRWWLAAIGLLVMILGGFALRVGYKRARDAPDTFLTADEERRILGAIAAFERRTSGEIRVHLARSAGPDIMDTARQVFEKLGMTATQERNGVLFFVAIRKRRFAVLGDSGIDAVVPDDFWNEVVEQVSERLRTGDACGGLVEGIRIAGEALAEHFPVAADDVNELPDEISREE